MRESSFRRSLGRSIKSFREAAAMTQRETAEVAGIADKYLSRIELGLALPSIYVTHRIAAAIGVGIEQLTSTASQSLSPDLIAIVQRVRRLSPRETQRVRRVIEAMVM